MGFCFENWVKPISLKIFKSTFIYISGLDMGTDRYSMVYPLSNTPPTLRFHLDILSLSISLYVQLINLCFENKINAPLLCIYIHLYYMLMYILYPRVACK